MRRDVDATFTRAQTLCERAKRAHRVAHETIDELRRQRERLTANIGRSRLVTRTIMRTMRPAL